MPLRATSMAATTAAVVTALALSPHLARADMAPSAYPTCNATLSNLVATYSNGNYIKLEIFWDNANGTNCAYLRHGSAAPSGAIYTFVNLRTCTTNTVGARCDARGSYPSRYNQADEGKYTAYAGKVTVDGRDRCIWAVGGIDITGDGRADRYIDVNNSTSDDPSPRGKHCD